MPRPIIQQTFGTGRERQAGAGESNLSKSRPWKPPRLTLRSMLLHLEYAFEDAPYPFSILMIHSHSHPYTGAAYQGANQYD